MDDHRRRYPWTKRERPLGIRGRLTLTARLTDYSAPGSIGPAKRLKVILSSERLLGPTSVLLAPSLPVSLTPLLQSVSLPLRARSLSGLRAVCIHTLCISTMCVSVRRFAYDLVSHTHICTHTHTRANVPLCTDVDCREYIARASTGRRDGGGTVGCGVGVEGTTAMKVLTVVCRALDDVVGVVTHAHVHRRRRTWTPSSRSVTLAPNAQTHEHCGLRHTRVPLHRDAGSRMDGWWGYGRLRATSVEKQRSKGKGERMRFNRVGEEKEGRRQMDRDREGRIGVGWGEKRRRVNSGEGSLLRPRGCRAGGEVWPELVPLHSIHGHNIGYSEPLLPDCAPRRRRWRRVGGATR